MRSIDNSKIILKFFENHMKWINENILSDKDIIIDITVLPDNIHMPLTTTARFLMRPE